MEPIMRDFNHIKEWLLPILQKQGISLEALGRAAGISRASMYHYLNDKRRPKTEVMRKICEILKVDPEEGLRQYVERPTGRPKGAS
jgi:transcriptional regulator with XRE-family HTH domain